MGDGVGVKSLVAGYNFNTSAFVLLSCDVSGQLLVNIDNIDSITIASGASIVIASGVGVTINSQSGTPRIIAGSGGFMPGVVAGNGATYSTTDFYVKTIAGNIVFDTPAGTWRPLSSSQSGLRNIQIATSGLNHVITNASGESSGIGVTLNSGAPVSVSGNILIGKFSGETVATQIPTSGRTRGIAKVTSLSGGDLLASGDSKTITVRVVTKASGGTNDASGFMLLGFDAAGERPFVGAAGFELDSGYGIILYPGDAYTVDMNNMNKIRVCAKLSGEMIAYGANVY